MGSATASYPTDCFLASASRACKAASCFSRSATAAFPEASSGNIRLRSSAAGRRAAAVLSVCIRMLWTFIRLKDISDGRWSDYRHTTKV